MDTIIFIISALITVMWSVWFYILWQEKAGLPEESTARFLLLIAPSTYVFTIAVSNWVNSVSIRLDLLGLLALDLLTLICSAILFVLTRSSGKKKQQYIHTLLIYNGVAILIIALLYLIRLYPPLLIRVSAFFRQIEEFNIMTMSWIALNPENHEQDLAGFLNKVIIALCSYIPISILRMLYVSRQRKRMEKDLTELKARIRVLEKRIQAVGEEIKL